MGLLLIVSFEKKLIFHFQVYKVLLQLANVKLNFEEKDFFQIQSPQTFIFLIINKEKRIYSHLIEHTSQLSLQVFRINCQKRISVVSLFYQYFIS